VKAKEEMAESKYPKGANVTLFEYEPGEPVTVSEVIAAELQKIGIHVQIKVAANIGSYEAEYDPPVVDKLIKAGIGITDRAERFAIYSTLLKRPHWTCHMCRSFSTILRWQFQTGFRARHLALISVMVSGLCKSNWLSDDWSRGG
jgi:MarR-like DNA-binding transcriptional regulator SgrR of sgrS sRNA